MPIIILSAPPLPKAIAKSINTAGLNAVGAQHDFLHRAAKEGVNVLLAQETLFKDSSAIPFGKWLLIGSGALPPRKTGVAIYIAPNARGALVN